MTLDAGERRALADAVRDASSAGPREFLGESGCPVRDDRLWKLLSEQMGLAGLVVPTEHGGAGAGTAEAVVVLEELAGSLAVVPALSSLGIATMFLRVVGTPEAAEYLTVLGAGEATATVCWPRADSPDVEPVVVADGADGSSFTGRTEFVIDGTTADILLMPARIGDEVVVIAVSADREGVHRDAMRGLDLTRALTVVELDGVPGTVIGRDVDLRPALDLALTLVAAEQVGIAQQCHDSAVTWAKDRVQFERPIGQFQAIKHALVDLLMDLELARSSLDIAVAAADAYLDEPSDRAASQLRVAAAAAKARCAEAAMSVADETLHILGGIGFTWEHDAHLYFRRAKALEVLFGSPASHRARFASQLLQVATGD